MDQLAQQQHLLAELAKPERFPHPVGQVERLETHLSTILLAGDYAYKIKKPLDLGFADFTDLAKRGHFCAEEVRLNQRLAPELYLRRAAITGTVEAPTIDGVGAPIEYAVVMRRFPQEALLDHLLKQNALPPDSMETLGAHLAAVHAAAPAAPADSTFGQPRHIAELALDNLRVLAKLAPPDWQNDLEKLLKWTRNSLKELELFLIKRCQQGLVRECHGDLHLGNMLLWQGKFFLFDAIEFDPGLRWIDLMSDLAFALMDLDSRGAVVHARRLKNSYLEASGDYGGLAVLRFYQAYRALVRAKIAILRVQQFPHGEPERTTHLQESWRYIDLALSYGDQHQPRLAITCGLSGSGKSTAALKLVDHAGFVRIRSDIERKRLFGLAALQRSAADIDAGIYSAAATAKTYRRLAELTATALAAGERVIVDATFLKQAQRQPFTELARGRFPLDIVLLEASDAVLQRRIESRSRAAKDPSEATAQVLARQRRYAEWPTPAEGRIVRVATDRPGWEAELDRDFS